MEDFLNWLIPILKKVGLKLAVSILLFVIGRLITKALVRALREGKATRKMEPTVAHFLANFVNVALYIILIVTIIAILGVPMASVVAAIASAGVAIGLALQGALSNFAGHKLHPWRQCRTGAVNSGTDAILKLGGYPAVTCYWKVFRDLVRPSL